ncbi:MAG: 4-hydroxy-tetrahydrodipicolinate synthase [Wenzhouxiangellaceae bacterium]
MFQGSIVALITPLNAHGAIDLETWQQLLLWHVDQGTSGVVVAGTTGESATLTDDEFNQLLSAAVATVGGKLRILAGTGSASTRTAVERTRRAEQLGADGALIVTPYYNRPGQEGLYAHYRTIAEAVSLPIVLYNVPARTAVDLAPATVARLAAIDNIVAIKEAHTAAGRLNELRKLTPSQFDILSGDDPTAAASMLEGAVGVISVVANAAPASIARLCELARGGQREAAIALDQQLSPLYRLAALGGNPTGIKWCLWHSKRIQRGIRLPLTWMSADLEEEAEALWQQSAPVLS